MRARLPRWKPGFRWEHVNVAEMVRSSATHEDALGRLYRARGYEVLEDGRRWVACHWGDCNPLDHLDPLSHAGSEFQRGESAGDRDQA